MIQLKLKLADFAVLTRQGTLAEPSNDGQQIYRAALALLAKVTLEQKVRLTGVSAHGIQSEGEQLSLFAEQVRSDKLNETLDRIAEKFGRSAVIPADVLGRGSGGDDLR